MTQVGNWFLGLIPVSHLPVYSLQTAAAIAARHYEMCPAIITAALTLTSSPLCRSKLTRPSHESVPIREATSRLTRHIHKLDQKDQDTGGKAYHRTKTDAHCALRQQGGKTRHRPK